MKPEEEIRRAEEAAAILANPLVVEAFSKLKQEIIEKWSDCPARDTEGREWLWQHYQCALKFQAHFEQFVNTGKIAKDLVRQQGIQDRIKQAWGKK